MEDNTRVKRALQAGGKRLDKGWCQVLELKPVLFHKNRTFCAKAGGRSGVTGRFSGQILHFSLDQL